MKEEEFISRIQEELELDMTLTPDTVLNEIDEWSSMSVMIVIALVSEVFNVNLNGEDIKRTPTIQSLIEKIGVEKFI